MGDGGGTCTFLTQTATMFALNSPGSLQSLHRYLVRRDGSTELRPVSERVERACLMREVGLKSIGLIGTPKAINNLAALRAMVDEDKECAAAMPNEPRRCVSFADAVKSVRANGTMSKRSAMRCTRISTKKSRSVCARCCPTPTQTWACTFCRTSTARYLLRRPCTSRSRSRRGRSTVCA